ncbi:G2 M phase-specific E3 ubiquitin- ligase-like protein [Labeo rohita]|uniref:G2 M phase-specific E3 ubiquitin-ligase-like protein n=1 Tax=Labeo rohita TaxID=84645 RepID=A0A498LXR6_LABRO|nr:G2 M phase-specific E3 ubiquitin- ligase-like protein [Labeo rohita]
MPLQILALHVKECNTAEYETLSDSEPELSNLPPDSPDLSPATEEKIEETSDLLKYSDQIMSCGYTGPINDQNKGNIKRAIAMHATARRTLMLQQLREGLQLYHLVDIMEKNKEVCRSLFVFEGGNDQVDSQYIVSHLDPKMSESGTLKHSKEMQILNNFQNFLMELEEG